MDGPKAALDLLDGGEHVDLLFTDLVMPGGVDGTMLARAARARRPRIGILLTTGYAEASLEGEDGPEFEVIDKPYGRTELARRVRALLDAPTDGG
ncbi:hypothetical protein ACFZ8E_22820 [Methylobacterium sp. HMF5984]|uniref:hypothetical protein n=1 Tax=Methylobacterium sp. HMF5984 TaxID=3367370 RepID=UPI0038531ADA